MAYAFGYGFCAGCYDFYTRVSIIFDKIHKIYKIGKAAKRHPGEIDSVFHWAPTAGSLFYYNPVYDGICASLQQAWTN